MITTDIQTVEHLAFDVNFLWIGVLETVVVLTILWSHVGITILLAMLYTFAVIILQILCGKWIQILW